ncbi:MAG: ATP-binding protein [Lachnospiraceae bacterium]|nr:ATP-binding protein [Lachnospiraceae bacterium]
MTDLYTIIQRIMKYHKNGQNVEIILKSGDKIRGIISDFTGKEFVVGDLKILVSDVSSIEEWEELAFDNFIMKRVEIITVFSEVLDAVLVSADKDEISYITENGQKTMKITEIKSITCDNLVIFSREDSDETHFEDKADTSTEKTYGEEDNAVISDVENQTINIEEERIIIETKEDVENEEKVDLSYEPNAFEEGLINGNKALVGQFISQNDRLKNLGYTEKEIERIRKVYGNSKWKKDLYSIASRINLFQSNKNGLAEKYYEMALKNCSKGSYQYIKILNMLVLFYLDEEDEKYIAFWRKYAFYFKDNIPFCNDYISAILRSKNIMVNAFEKALIIGDMDAVVKLLSNESLLEEMGYSSIDIDRIRKALKLTNWDVSWYKTATRLFGMQLNRDGLAEIFYEAALIVSQKKSEEYTKILNALASIKIGQNRESFIPFFETYRKYLETNINFCITYVNALIAVQNWDMLINEMPLLREKLAGNPTFLEKIDAEIEFHNSMPPFELSEFAVLSNRLQDKEKLYDQEEALIERLPDRHAIKALLDIYFFNRNEDAYFELQKYALFFVKEDKISMTKLLTMMTETQKSDVLIYFMECIPVFWCNESLIKKYLKAKGIEDINNLSLDNPRLEGHIRSIVVYNTPNSFENSIINRDLDTLKIYIEKPELLEELGYSDSEIEDIKLIDIEQQFSEDYYTMRRILAFQGNKNHLAEQYLFEAFYSNKIDMCNRLFPLLLAERRGELILSLFEFDRTLNSKMSSLMRLYYLALCIAEKDNDVFFECMESKWMDYPDDIILDRMLAIAKEKNDELLVKQLEIQKNRPRSNAFETAIIEADNDAIRKYVKSANLLVELGYTPEEIQKISKIFTLGGSNNGSKPGQIANRVYLYQKNKNNLAERLFLNAITEDSQEDVITDCKALYQIYTGQHNYEMVCKIYEDYLHEEMKEKFNGLYASSYCVALYELGRYQDFLDYYKHNREQWDNFTLYTPLLYICEVLDTHEFDDVIWDNISSTQYRPDIIARYIQYILNKDVERIYSEKVIDLINTFFVRFLDEDIFEIKNKINGISVQNIDFPKGGLIIALISDENSEVFLNAWFDFIYDLLDSSTKIDLIIKIANIFPQKSGFIVNKAIKIYKEIESVSAVEYKMEMLEELISHHVNGSDEIVSWCNILAQSLQIGKGSVKSLNNYLIISQTIDEKKEFWDVYLDFKKNTISELKPDALFEVIWNYYESVRNSINIHKKNEIVLELIRISDQFTLDYIGCKNMSTICSECGMDFESRIYLQASNRLVNQENDMAYSLNDNNDNTNTVNYYNYLLDKLNTEKFVDSVSLFSGWAKYLLMTEEESLVIDRLRNTVKDSDLWEWEEINILSKAIICDPSNYLYWKLLRTWIEKNETNNKIAIGNILFQISSQGERELESALGYAVENGFKAISLNLLMKMLDVYMIDISIAAQKKLRTMINKNWFSYTELKDKTSEIFIKIKDNITLSDAEDFLWNSVCVATDLAIATEEYGLFISTYSEYLSKNCAKQCCVIISDMILKDNLSGIDAAFGCLENALLDIPYKNLVSDMYENYKKRSLTDYEKMALVCVKKDYGNLLGVNDLLGFYYKMTMSNMKKCGLETIELLLKYAEYDPVLYEVAACFLRDEKGIKENEMYYNYMYDYLESIQNDNPVGYLVGSMVCGENLLRLNGKEVRSFKKIIEERFSNYLDLVKKYQEFCDCIVVGLRTTEYEDFAQILFRAVFSGDWKDVFEYKSADNIVNTVLAKYIKTDRINVADDYYRSVIKGVALFVINHSDNMWDIIENSDRARMLWNNIGNAGCDFDYFSNVVQSLDDIYLEELRKIWSLDIETLTVYKNYLGKCIISQPNCCNYSEIFSVFINARSGDIFANVETQDYLKSIDKDIAINICENYERLYIRAAGPTILYSTGKSVFKDSDYESNIFSVFLHRNTKDYFSNEKRYERFKKKYELIERMYNISSLQNANDMSFSLNLKRKIFSVRSLYFYYSVLVDKVDKRIFQEENNYIEVINAITIALSDDKYLTGLYDFVSKFDENVWNMLGVLVLIEQDKINDAANRVIETFSGKIRGYLCAKLVASYGKKGNNTELCKQCLRISKSYQIPNNFWIKNYSHCKSINKIDEATYLPRAEVMSESSNKKVDNDIKSNITDKNKIEYRSLKVDTSEEKIEEEMTLDIPLFIKSFIEKEYEDAQLSQYQNKWKKAKKAFDNGTGTQESLNEISINIGICLIKHQESKVDETIMRDTFALIQKYSVQDTYLIGALHDIFQKYVCEYTNLDSLALSVYENREAIKHLCYEQDINQKSRISQDIEAVTMLIKVLDNIADDLSSTMGEESIKERLIAYQEKIFKETKGVSKFRNASAALSKMIQEKINSINFAPYLVISHLGSVSADNNKENSWRETWLEGAEKGYVRGVVLNCGGAPASRIELNITVNFELRETFTMEKIAPGRKIPFIVPYQRNDVIDSKVSWGADVTYFDENNGKSHTSNTFGEIAVSFSNEEWGISHVGREKFNAQLAAEGDDFCGRTNELLKLENLYNINNNPDRYPSLLVTGLRRAGKSSVIKFFREKLRERDNLAPIFVDAQGIYGDITKAFFDLTFNELYRWYRDQMEGFVDFKKRWEEISRTPDWVGQLPSYFMELSGLLGGRKIIFILDEMENVFYANHFDSAIHEEEFFGMIRSIIQNYQEFVSFIFCGSDKLLTSCLEQKRESQMFQVLQRIYVGRMNIKDIRDMFEKYNKEYEIKFRDDAIDSIMYYTNGLIWYTKVIAYNILDRIVDQEHIIRDEIHVSDVNMIVELLIKGDLGAELIDLLDNNFGAKRKAIIRAMARVTNKPNDSVNVDQILFEFNKLHYVDDDTGEVLGNIVMDDLRKNLDILEKMDFIVKDPHQENAYCFSTELYRLLMLNDRKIDKFVKTRG